MIIGKDLFVSGLLLVIVFSGCGQKKEAAPVIVPVQEETAAGELPELEQNKIFQASAAQAPPPDYSFEPVPDGQEAPLEEQAPVGD